MENVAIGQLLKWPNSYKNEVLSCRSWGGGTWVIIIFSMSWCFTDLVPFYIYLLDFLLHRVVHANSESDDVRLSWCYAAYQISTEQVWTSWNEVEPSSSSQPYTIPAEWKHHWRTMKTPVQPSITQMSKTRGHVIPVSFQRCACVQKDDSWVSAGPKQLQHRRVLF